MLLVLITSTSDLFPQQLLLWNSGSIFGTHTPTKTTHVELTVNLHLHSRSRNAHDRSILLYTGVSGVMSVQRSCIHVACTTRKNTIKHIFLYIAVI